MRALSVSVLIFDAFSNMALACLLEPLRVVRDQTGADVKWTILTEGDRELTSSSGMTIAPMRNIRDAEKADLVLVVGGDTYREFTKARARRCLDPLIRDATVIAADTGAWILARGGYLHGRKATVHWQVLDEFAEAFSGTVVQQDRYFKDGSYWTCGSASAALDLTLEFIRDWFGPAAAFDAGAMFLHDNSRRHGASFPDKALSQSVSPVLKRTVALMSGALENPHSIPALAKLAHISERSLYRLFISQLHTTPGRYYLLLRLARARELARYSDFDAHEIAPRCGFASAITLRRSLRANFGIDLKAG